MKMGRKVPPHGGNGKLPGGIPHLRHTATMDLTLIEQGNLRSQ